MMRSGDILIVEDDPDISSSLAELLETEGYHATVASNGVQALELIKNRDKPLALILLDYMMPVMDGMKFLETLKKDNPNYLTHVGVVVLTAAAEMKFKLPQDVDLIKKPIDVDQLLKFVEKYCQKPA